MYNAKIDEDPRVQKSRVALDFEKEKVWIRYVQLGTDPSVSPLVMVVEYN